MVLNFSFCLRRLENESAEQQFRHVAMAVALMGLLATWENTSSLQSEGNVQHLGALLGFLGAITEQCASIMSAQQWSKENGGAAAALDCGRTDARSKYPVLGGIWAGFTLSGLGMVTILPQWAQPELRHLLIPDPHSHRGCSSAQSAQEGPELSTGRGLLCARCPIPVLRSTCVRGAGRGTTDRGFLAF